MTYTVADLFRTMHERFKPEVTGDLEATVVYEFGDGRKWTVRISKGLLNVDVGDSAQDQENIRIVFKTEDVMLDIIRGKINPIKAIIRGDSRVVGNWELLVKVRSTFEIPSELLGGDNCGC